MAAANLGSQSIAHQHHLYRLWNGQGYSMLQDAYYEDALTCFNRAIAINPDQAESWHGRGEALANLGFYREAFSCFNTVLELEPNYSQAWALRARMLFYCNHATAALESCNQALTLQPSDAETWMIRGATLQRLGQAEEADASYEKALRLQRQPKLTSAMNQSIRRIRQLMSWSSGQPRSSAIGQPQRWRLQRDRSQQDKPSNGWETTMTYSAGLIMLLMLLQLIPVLQPESNLFGLVRVRGTATLWIQNKSACQASGRHWQQGICWE